MLRFFLTLQCFPLWVSVWMKRVFTQNAQHHHKRGRCFNDRGWGWVLPVMLAPTFRPVSFVLTHRNQSSCEVGCSVEDGYAIRRLNVIFISKRTFTVYTWHWQLYLCSSPVPFFRTPETRETNQLRPFKTDCVLVTASSAPPHQHTDFVLWFFLLRYGHDREHESW